MPDLSPAAQAVLAELEPFLHEVLGLSKPSPRGPAVTPATVQSVDPTTGVAWVLPDLGTNPIQAEVVCALPAVGDRVHLVFWPPHGPVVLGRVAGMPGLLSYAETDADVNLSTVAAIGATTLVGAQALRLLEADCHAGALVAGGAQVITGYVQANGVYIGQVGWHYASGALQAAHINGSVMIPITAKGPVTVEFMLVVDSGIAVAQAQPRGTVPGPITLTVRDAGSTLGFF